MSAAVSHLNAPVGQGYYEYNPALPASQLGKVEHFNTVFSVFRLVSIVAAGIGLPTEGSVT